MILMFLTAGHGPVRWLLGISEGGFVVVVGITWILLPRDPSPLPGGAEVTPWASFKEDVRWIRESPALVWYVYQTIFANAAISILLALVVYDMGHQGLFQQFPIIAVLGAGLGMGLGGFSVSFLSSRIPLLWLIAGGRLAFAMRLVGVAQMFSIFGFAGSLALVFWGQNASGTALVTWRTQSTPLTYQGRISSTIAQISSITSWIFVP